MKADLRVRHWEVNLSAGGGAPSGIAGLNATFFHAVDATAKRKTVTEEDLKEQLHVLCSMLSQLESSEAVDKKLEQQEIDTLKAEVATLREEIDKCKLEEKKQLEEDKTKEAPAAPAPAAEPESFDCEAGAANWKLGWSQAKKDHCCRTLHVGCEFDCDAGFSNWKKGWSDKKKEYCCEEAKKGCKEDEAIEDEKEAEEKKVVEEKKNGSFNATGDMPAGATEPYNCDAGLPNWEKGWSDQKKEWCCKEKSLGCPFDCDAGVENWEDGWSEDKKEFCCESTDVGCKFDCAAGLPKWETGWSEAKKEWCCVNKQTPTCPDDAASNSSAPSTTEHLLVAAGPAPAPAAEEEGEAPPPHSEDGAPEERAEEAQNLHDQEDTKLDEQQQDETAGPETEPAEPEEAPPEAPEHIEPPLSEEARTVGEWDRPDHASRPREESSFDVDGDMPYGDLEPFGREDTAQELTEASIKESDEMVDQLERAEVAEEKRAVFRALTRLRGAAITSFDGIARSQTGNIDEYNKRHRWRDTHPLHHLADEESDVAKWAFPEDC
mmetsp:Transcript_20085/g.53850  ORF Transcript_20085/g.53850 Transcript_20085/m.53850 type:complete len:548 (+) Transcript_20085:2-1645(+)